VPRFRELEALGEAQPALEMLVRCGLRCVRGHYEGRSGERYGLHLIDSRGHEDPPRSGFIAWREGPLRGPLQRLSVIRRETGETPAYELTLEERRDRGLRGDPEGYVYAKQVVRLDADGFPNSVSWDDDLSEFRTLERDHRDLEREREAFGLPVAVEEGDIDEGWYRGAYARCVRRAVTCIEMLWHCPVARRACDEALASSPGP